MGKDRYVLGISMSRHDRAACLLKNGSIVAAIGEERLDRRKRSIGSYGHRPSRIILPPLKAVSYVLRAGGVRLDDLELIVCGRSMTSCREMLLQYLPLPAERVIEPPVPGHHLAHAYSAYATAPFDRSAVLVIDEQGHHLPDGRFEKSSWYEGEGSALRPIANFYGSDADLSLGMFYNAFAMLTSLSEAMAPAAGKLMGLASYGVFHPEWPELITLDEQTGDTHIPLQGLDDFFSQLGLPVRIGYEDARPRNLEDLARYISLDWSTALAADLAYKAQQELERAVLHISRFLKKNTKADKLSYAGGVALNCTSNSRLLETGWSDVYVHPAATDDGNAIGLAYYGWIEHLGNPQAAHKPFSPFTGITYASEAVDGAFASFHLNEYARTVSPAEEGALRLAGGEIVCWMQGGSEWGPRALGARSILANPQLTAITERINSTVKFREPFRPFAVSGLQEDLQQMIDWDQVPASLGMYMLATGSVKDARLYEVRHVDGRVRYQVVQPDLQPEFAALIQKFKAATGLGVVLNTSFNTLGEPLVESPVDAVRQFLLSGADTLIVGERMLVRREIPAAVLASSRHMAFERSYLDPLQTALGLESAGYPEQALKFLEESAFHERDVRWDGVEMVQAYHGLLMRAALREADLQKAQEQARIVFEWSGMPLEAIRAARAISEYPFQPKDAKLGYLMRYIASQGGGWKFLSDMLEEQSLPAVSTERSEP